MFKLSSTGTSGIYKLTLFAASDLVTVLVRQRYVYVIQSADHQLFILKKAISTSEFILSQ